MSITETKIIRKAIIYDAFPSKRRRAYLCDLILDFDNPNVVLDVFLYTIFSDNVINRQWLYDTKSLVPLELGIKTILNREDISTVFRQHRQYISNVPVKLLCLFVKHGNFVCQ